MLVEPRAIGGLAAAFLLLVCLGALVGCGTAEPPAAVSHSGHSEPSIERLSLLSAAVAIGGNEASAVNGIAAKVFAAGPGDKKTRPIRDGNLDFLLFDGMVKEVPPGGEGWRHIWSFTSKELAVMKIPTAIGTAYMFALAWGDDVPAGDTVTLVARYRPVRGSAIYSPPGYLLIRR